jgi:hypothetical protein
LVGEPRRGGSRGKKLREEGAGFEAAYEFLGKEKWQIPR